MNRAALLELYSATHAACKGKAVRLDKLGEHTGSDIQSREAQFRGLVLQHHVQAITNLASRERMKFNWIFHQKMFQNNQ
jgi:hypothetical protein